MKVYTAENIRNIALVGHGGEGKTTLAEAMLYEAGRISRQGRVEDGNTTMDFDPEEIKRQISISSAMSSLEWKSNKFNIIDSPGYFDFVGGSDTVILPGGQRLDCDQRISRSGSRRGEGLGRLQSKRNAQSLFYKPDG